MDTTTDLRAPKCRDLWATRRADTSKTAHRAYRDLWARPARHVPGVEKWRWVSAPAPYGPPALTVTAPVWERPDWYPGWGTSSTQSPTVSRRRNLVSRFCGWLAGH